MDVRLQRVLNRRCRAQIEGERVVRIQYECGGGCGGRYDDGNFLASDEARPEFISALKDPEQARQRLFRPCRRC
jgi:hypothetical protein